MKTVFVLFDTLNRSAMSSYGGATVDTPNFARFAERAVTFDTHYACSLPCMPARRDLHTGRPNFLHRAWGPLEPFDNSFPELLLSSGTYSHLITDHNHYFADGGATYHGRFSSWDLVRGNGNDHWSAVVEPPMKRFRDQYHPTQVRPYLVPYMLNRDRMREEEDHPGPQVFARGLEFLRTNGESDNWFLQLECFDPHEPFFAPDRFRTRYSHGYNGPIIDWPTYGRVNETPEEIAEIRAGYAALVAMCDEYFGRLLDEFDRQNLWEDTALIVSTDHGFLMGEHDYWGKNVMPVYDEQAHIPLMIYHPDFRSQGGKRRGSLTQTIDLMPTFLTMHGQPIPDEVLGQSLLPLLAEDRPIRETAIYGYFGSACNITDGRYTYFRYPLEMTAINLHEYTLMPTRMYQRFPVAQLTGATLQPPFDFTKGLPTLKVSAQSNRDGSPMVMEGRSYEGTVTVLFDTANDPGQETPITAPEVERYLLDHMSRQFIACDAPAEMYDRFGLPRPA